MIVEYRKEYKQDVFSFTDNCFRELGKKFEPDGRHYFYNDIETYFDVFFCLILDNKVVGTVGLKKINDDTVELKALYLSKELRGQGLGFKLINSVIDKAKEKGYKLILLDSMSKYKEALKLYEKVGFIKTERYNDNQYADVFMKLVLDEI
ncbi:GNAT family N-acetyltransferase [Eubacterium sp.]|uniref:GNAT family N-acetyltransferase n=1 Tax=Eubacterium sp. TaxID=142586 RepID=UPI0025CF4717|nr:GNAT family N-acetyltransferase [Eubacterium sp.]MCR5630043.1 GNAT family N-acetyltransferase [Eubacterium sp.]